MESNQFPTSPRVIGLYSKISNLINRNGEGRWEGLW